MLPKNRDLPSQSMNASSACHRYFGVRCEIAQQLETRLLCGVSRLKTDFLQKESEKIYPSCQHHQSEDLPAERQQISGRILIT